MKKQGQRKLPTQTRQRQSHKMLQAIRAGGKNIEEAQPQRTVKLQITQSNP